MNSDGSRFERWEPAAVFGVFAVLYTATSSRHLLGGDAGEFATIFADGGFGHPPGYPLYSLYLQAFGWLPVESPAHGAGLATALLGAGAVAWLYAAARAWGASRFAATFGAFTFGLAPHVWLYHTQPEAFALNHLLAGAIIWATAPSAAVSGASRVALLGLLAGCGLANHHTIVLLAPLGLWGVYRGTTESSRAAPLVLAAGVGTLAIGLLPYLYLPYVEASAAGWHWGAPEDLPGIVHIFLRRDYGTFQMTAGESVHEPLRQIGAMASGTTLDLYLVPVLAGAYAAARGLARGLRTNWGDEQSLITALLASLLLCGPGLAALLTTDTDAAGAMIARRFYLLPELLIAFLAVLGTHHLQRYLPDHRLRVAIVVALVVAAGPRIWHTHRVHHAATVEQYARDTFQTLPEEAVVVGTGDHNFFGALYLQRGLEAREDLLYIDAFLLAHGWYVDRIERRLDVDLQPADESIDTDRLFAGLLATGRPLFVTHPFTDGLLEGWPSAPRGTLIRVFPAGQRPPRPRALFRINGELFREFSVRVPTRLPENSWAQVVLEQYAVTWDHLASALERTGARKEAKRARRRAAAFRPWRRKSKAPKAAAGHD